MNTAVKEALQTAIANAKAVTGATGRSDASKALNDAIAAARKSRACHYSAEDERRYFPFIHYFTPYINRVKR